MVFFQVSIHLALFISLLIVFSVELEVLFDYSFRNKDRNYLEQVIEVYPF